MNIKAGNYPTSKEEWKSVSWEWEGNDHLISAYKENDDLLINISRKNLIALAAGVEKLSKLESEERRKKHEL